MSERSVAGHYTHIMFSSYQRFNKCAAVMLSFLFLSCISLSTNETSDESHTLLFKMRLCISEHPYLISTAFHIAKQMYCCPFSNPAYAASCLSAEPFS